ncbi:MAG: sigma-70 family RNA polymerase sigma factor [Chloroflexi bacterium]|jgi:RNA polymerase sigma-70 factor (ECF subfamily)|nr:sigma-70 family RNA polymerase sigma factor [Chloroflexota bacterium]
MPDDEPRLIQQAQAGNRSAFAALYRRYQQAVFTYVYYRVGDQYAAEDLAAEVFVRMVEKIGQYRHRGKPLLAWLYAIARNLLTDHYRLNARYKCLPLDETLATGHDDPAEETDHRLTTEAIARSLDCLTEPQRQVIIGRFIEGRSVAEMASILGKTEGAVKVLQYRALGALQRALKEKESEHAS